MNRLKQLRESKKLTLDDIERETGIKRGTYNNYENGKTDPKSNWQVLADYFNVSVPYLQGANHCKCCGIDFFFDKPNYCPKCGHKLVL